MRNIIGLFFALIGWIFVIIGMGIMPEDKRNEYATTTIKTLKERKLL